MSSVLPDDVLASALADWQLGRPLTVTRIKPLRGGTTSDTWYVDTVRQRYVAKYAYWPKDTFETGLRAAEIVEWHGIVSGAPVRTPGGTLTVLVQGPLGQPHPLALLRYVPGELLDLTEPDAPALVGSLLGQVHSILLRERYVPATPEGPFAYVMEDSEALDGQPGLRALIGEAITAVRTIEATHPMTCGVISGDGLEIMRERATGLVGIVDWGVRYWGPLIADVASSALQLRDVGQATDAFLRAYLTRAPLASHELNGLWAYMALRRAMGAKFYATCLVENVTRGLGNNENIMRRLAASRNDLEQLLMQGTNTGIH
ncbi:MAG: phosphotransferase [Chloroflexi bacterium]|nr:phosphotransferase [Chloroflexota bacterium]